MRRYLQVLFILCGLAGLALLSSLPVAWAMPEQSTLRFTVPTRTPEPQPTSPPPTSGGGGGGSNPSPTQTPVPATLTLTPPAGTKNLTPSPTSKADLTVTATPGKTATPAKTATASATAEDSTPVTGGTEEVALSGDTTEEASTATIPPAVNVTATPVAEDAAAPDVGIHPLFFWGIGLLGLGIVIIVLWRKLKA